MRLLHRSRFALFLLVTALCAVAQQPAKRPLRHTDADSWRAISAQQLSHDGKYVAYALFPQEGDGELVARELATGRELRQPIGVQPPPPEPDPASLEEEPPRPRTITIAFTPDTRFVVFSTFPSKAETDQARKAKKKADEMPKGGLVMLDLSSGAATQVAGVKSFQVADGDLVAYLKEGGPGAPRAQKYGTELVLRDLRKAEERTFADVTEYSLTRDGKTLVYTVSSKTEENNGAFLVAAGAAGEPVALLKGKGKYAKLAWDSKQQELAFLAESKLYVWGRAVAAMQHAAVTGCKAGLAISDRGAVAFSRDGNRVFVGCAPPAPEEKKADDTPADEKVSVDLWHWRDPFIQPMQKLRATRDRNRTFRAVFNLTSKKFLQVADETMEELQAADGGHLALGYGDAAYRRMVDYDGRYLDYYAVDLDTGARTPLLKQQRAGGPASATVANLSPDGRYFLFFRDKNWHTVRLPDGAIADLTLKRGVNFQDERDDHPEEPASYGSAGWTRDGKSVLVYDRYDVWQISPDGTTAHNLTRGAGRREKSELRAVRLREPDEGEPRGVDPAKPLLLRAENERTHDSGFWRVRFDGNSAPETLLMGPKNYRTLARAKDADVVLLTAQTFNQFPDLQVTDSTFRDLRRISDANPQQARMLWGTAELVDFENTDGVALQAALYKPENFDPGKKYPMIVYLYERLSQNVNTFVPPRPGHSINISHYVSNGYLVLTPDIVYTVGHPGQSALKCVLPAVQAVVNRGYVNENTIGIQGHSWGGYQIAYMLTQTTRFRAAEAGAPVGNMTSAYNGIRWGTGLPRQFQYEKTQSRIGASLWEAPQLYIDNSAVFQANRIQTPLLILHNDADTAVPWYQGIELYLSMRRLGKEVYFFSYNGEPHGLRRRPNQKDYTVRLQQFFDHYLKDGPMPDWMERGIPYLEKEPKGTRMNTDGRGSNQD